MVLTHANTPLYFLPSSFKRENIDGTEPCHRTTVSCWNLKDRQMRHVSTKHKVSQTTASIGNPSGTFPKLLIYQNQGFSYKSIHRPRQMCLSNLWTHPACTKHSQAASPLQQSHGVYIWLSYKWLFQHSETFLLRNYLFAEEIPQGFLASTARCLPPVSNGSFRQIKG